MVVVVRVEIQCTVVMAGGREKPVKRYTVAWLEELGGGKGV